MGITSKSFYKNPEVIFILIYNLATLVCFAYGGLEPMYVLWSYFIQSVYIGCRYWFMQIYAQFKTTQPQWITSLFFPVHYGGFHMGYYIFLSHMSRGIDMVLLRNFMFINVAILMVQFVLFVFRNLSVISPSNTILYFIAPYIRIIPMHLIIIIGIKVSKFGVNTFYLFILLKIWIDLITYRWFELLKS